MTERITKRKRGLRRVRRGERLWPGELDRVDDPPATLWLRGREELLAREPGEDREALPDRVAIVGTRSPTPYGEAQARRFASILAERGFCIVSGLARGIDHCAHAAALEVGGATIAVLGSGVDRPWPGGELAARVGREGLLLSEYPPGQSPRRHHFPLRNRLISGLARVVLVVEAAHASGSLITARWAADQGREVFAVPGRVDQPMARGCHRLLREGARLVEDPGEILEELGAGEEQQPGGARRSKSASPLREDVLARALIGETLTADELATRLDLPLPEVLARLVGLELAGAVVRAPGGLYRRPARESAGPPEGG